MINNEEQTIEYLPFPDCIRKRVGVYLGSADKAACSTCLREITDNATDEISAGFGNTIHVSSDFNGWNYVADNGRGIPIRMSKDVPEKTEAYLSISELHSSGKFNTGGVGRVGLNGLGSSAVNAVSDRYVLLIRVTESNWEGSIPEVTSAWRDHSRGELYYIVACEKGQKVYENCLRLKDIEKILFRGIKDYQPIPKGMSTLVFFKLDSEIFEESTKPEVPVTNLNYFLLIQRQFFGRKDIKVLIDGVSLECRFNPYRFEVVKTITPKDPLSPNKEVGIYLTFEADPELKDNSFFASVNGLDCRLGYHVNLTKNLFKAAFKDLYKVSHEYVLEGIRFGVIILANECVYSSQVKENLKSISKVKADDFLPVVKEIEKILKKNSDYWDLHIEKVNALYDSRRNIGAIEKAEKMINASSGTAFYKNKSNLVDGFSDATLKNRWDCELYIVEGNSPAGSLKSGRKAENGGLKQAVLPLRGKVLNVSNIEIDRALENKEISTLFSILGVGIQEKNVTSGATTWEEAQELLMKHSRYSRICLACDAD